MFDDHNRVALIAQLMQHVEQLLDIRKVQTGSRLIQNIQRLTGAAFGELTRQLHALGFTARQRSGGLPQTNVGQTDVHQGLQLTRQRRDGVKELARLFDGHVQHFVDGLAFVLNFQRFAVIAFTFALVARDVDVRQEVHLNFDDAIALARFTAAAAHVKAEPSRRVPA